ncbi:GNAT family N-acetyltransferase [Glutamicibacter sp. NPDC087344]|uniref:GNAT family N-acetyltransferase n=1 Tax=Glutamicibacter sp. NPDC087344 TaxID=3363994 RepID=UPI0037FF7988
MFVSPESIVNFPEHSTDGVSLRLIQLPDLQELTAAYVRNRTHLAPWEPERPEEFFTDSGQHKILQGQLEGLAAGTTYPAALFEGHRLIGRFTLTGIIRGPFQSASLGYWVDKSVAGKGLATLAVRAICDIAGSELGLHRIEASTLRHNHASQKVLNKCGFEQIGMAPHYLQIAGHWQDHNLYQRILHR